MSFQRPPSAQRPPTSGVPIGMRPPSRVRNGPEIVPPSRGITVTNRPLTKEGLPSAHTQSGQRQVADKSYFIGILRQKVNSIIQEIQRLQTEIDTRKRGQSIQVNLSQQVDELREEIAKSEAELGDYNVLSDRVANGVSLDEMIANFQEIEQSNNQQESEVNRLFREKRDLESIVSDQEQQVQEMMRGHGAQAFQDMAKEIEKLDSEISKQRNQAGDLKGKSREELLQMVKDSTTKIGDTEKKIQDEQKSINYLQSQLKQIDERASDLQTERGQHYLKLLQREKDMNNFIQNFPQMVEQTKQEISQTQRSVFDTLVQTSRDLESVNEMPTFDNYKQLQNDLQIKERLMQDAQSTADKLRSEVENRRQELENLQNVDSKINDEIALIKEQMKQMELEMPKFADVDTIRDEGEIKKKNLEKERDLLKAQLHQLRKATNVLTAKHNEVRSQLRGDKIHAKIHSAEKEIRTRAAENYSILECIEDNKRRTNYSIVKRACLKIVSEINSLL
ncbi:hypothetical protein TRFO_24429 [Tritrichomonas foetus]|uniref:Uncharacterized protein n=1 Tax=Tritrichomonas foetus TaxID=1144522 RepID=A0A1J4K8U1_9EUKA|nr:hypothetical protein TRFO_24429 [Tritrichomonas foetus]|eukprot:OHT07354.1 hypothetical protein TRFO_24429 [Tritrichomonas foetus]